MLNLHLRLSKLNQDEQCETLVHGLLVFLKLYLIKELLIISVKQKKSLILLICTIGK